MIYDSIIIGKGPAGVTAGIYLARANKNVLIIGNGYGALENAESIDNYYALDNMSGKELATRGENQAKSFGAKILEDEVTAIEYMGDFNVKTKTESYTTKTVLIATGKPKKKISAKKFDEFVGRGISFCAVCDGFLNRGKSIALIGCGDYAAHEFEVLENFTKDITVFTNGDENISEKFSGKTLIKEKITAVDGDTRVNKIITENGEYNTDAIFVAIGTADSSNLAKTLGILTEKNDIIVDKNMMTNVSGIFAAGDCIGGLLQVVTASADGANAAVGILNYLKEKK